jgi:hypothetical protein
MLTDEELITWLEDPLAEASLLHADRHQWGPGLIHVFDDEKEKTLCGKTIALCPGKLRRGAILDVTCKVCTRSLDARLSAARYAVEARRIREEENQRWWEAYNGYLASPAWREKRRRGFRASARHL